MGGEGTLGGVSAGLSRRAAQPNFAFWPYRSAGQAGPPRTRICRTCARFITRRRRLSTSSRTNPSSIASAAAPMAMRSGSRCGPTISTSSRRSRSWRARRGWLSRRRPRKSGSGRSGKKPCSKRPRPRQLSTRSGCGRPAGRARANICKDAGSIRRRSDVSVWAGPRMIARRCGAPSSPNFPIRC